MKRNITKLLALLLAGAMLSGCASDTPSASSSDSAVTAEASSTTENQESAEGSAQSTTTPSQTTTTPAPALTTEEESAPADESEETPADIMTIESAQTPEESEEVPVQTSATTTTAATSTTQTTTTTEQQNPEEVPMEEKLIALTFDDGPNTTTTPQVLDVLEKYDITASFFLIGNNITDASAEVVKRAYDMGCEIHNHSKSHPYMNEMSVDEIIAEFQYTDNKVFEITGEHTGFFRPPYIAVNQDMLDNIDVPFIAGIGCNDWDPKVPADRRAKMILKQAKDGDIILLHDAEGNDLTVEALDTIIPELKAQGYRFVTVTELFNEKGIEISADDTKVYTNVLQKGQFG